MFLTQKILPVGKISNPLLYFHFYWPSSGNNDTAIVPDKNIITRHTEQWNYSDTHFGQEWRVHSPPGTIKLHVFRTTRAIRKGFRLSNNNKNIVLGWHRFSGGLHTTIHNGIGLRNGQGMRLGNGADFKGLTWRRFDVVRD